RATAQRTLRVKTLSARGFGPLTGVKRLKAMAANELEPATWPRNSGPLGQGARIITPFRKEQHMCVDVLPNGTDWAVGRAACDLPGMIDRLIDRYRDVTAALEVITPEMASTYLARRHPRHPGGTAAARKRYADLMRRGLFGLGNTMIIFSPDGLLLNGLTRLEACGEAGVAFPGAVGRNVPEDCVLCFNTGKRRTNDDMLQAAGIAPVGSRLAALLHALRHGASTVRDKLAPPDLVAFYQRHAAAVAFARSLFGNTVVRGACRAAVR